MPKGVYERTEFHKSKMKMTFQKGHTVSPDIRNKISKKLKGKYVGTTNSNYKTGRMMKNRYILVHSPNHPFSDKDGYMAEHRLMMEQKLGRYLTRDEIVHHIDHNKQNNHPDNLYLFANNHEHTDYHAMLRCFVREALQDG